MRCTSYAPKGRTYRAARSVVHNIGPPTCLGDAVKETNCARREFLGMSVAAAGASLAAHSMVPLPGNLIPAAVAASDRVRFGMVGVGMQGNWLLSESIKLPGVECAAAADLYDGRHTLAREIVRADLPVTRRYQTLLEDKNIDCIVAAVPRHSDKHVGGKAGSARKGQYCGKAEAAAPAPRRGTGVAGDLLVHLISGMMFMLGINEPPKQASAVGGIRRWKDGRNMPDVHAVVYYFGDLPVYMRLNLGTEMPEAYRIQGSKGVLDVTGSTLSLAPQTGKDNYPSYYTGSYPHAMREAYLQKWHEENDPKLGEATAMPETISFSGPDFDDVRPHLWTFFEAVRTRKPVVEDVVFGHNAALACHMANESYFRKSTVSWDEASKTIKGG